MNLSFEGMKYLVKYPSDFEETKKYPVLIYVHGAGMRGTDIAPLTQNAFFKITDEHENFPFVRVAPLCSEDTWFDIFERLKRFVDFIRAEPFADRKKIYLIGNSMGGYATWQLSISIPDRFAAVVPICGGGMYWDAGRLRDLPVWAFHGEDDTVVLPEESRKMVDAVNACGGNARLTVYKNTMHDSWSETYRNPEVFKWMLSHSTK